jgi:PAS domain S-box-containing protein
MCEGALTLASDGLVVYSNPAFAAMLGLDRGRLPGQLLETFVSPDQRDVVRALLKKADGRGTASLVKLRREDGSILPAQISVSPLHAGSFDGFAAIVTDLTEQIRREAAEEANRVKGEFLAMMSHELRTPLNAIAGHVQLIEMGVHGPVNDAQRGSLARVQASEQQLRRLITNVLNFSRLEGGHLEYDIHDMDLTAALLDVPSLFAPQLQSTGLSATVDVSGLVFVRGDRDKVDQIVLNLMSNAIKFTPRGGRITLRATIDNGLGAGWLQVSDTGRGIPKEKIESIFEPFVQVDRSMNYMEGGVGLGLAISRTLARGMGGDLTAASVVGGGSTFTLALPLMEQ